MDAGALDEAVEALKAGDLVGLPTETVYGLAGDARKPESVAKIYAAKGRPRFNPLIAHVADLNAAKRQGVFHDRAEALAEAFWPGPLTLVLEARPDGSVCELARAGLSTLAVRVPAHPIAQAVLEHFDGPLAAPSGNRSGSISPTTADHVREGLGGAVSIILDGGACARGLESSVIGFDGSAAYLLRPGALAREAIEAVIGPLLKPKAGAEVSSPGMLSRHYAPQGRLRLNAVIAENGEGLVGFGSVAGDVSLSTSGDLTEAAARLFACLRDMDRRFSRIAVAPIPDHGLGEAINDRLRRASTP